jgi:hypothetical protein
MEVHGVAAVVEQVTMELLASFQQAVLFVLFGKLLERQESFQALI